MTTPPKPDHAAMTEVELSSSSSPPPDVDGDDTSPGPDLTEEFGDDGSGNPLEEQVLPMPDDVEDMDPLEYSVRKVLPIPRAYFWQTGNTEVSLRTKVWHRTVATLGTLLRAAEFAGEVVAHVFGLNESRYQYVMDSMDKEDWERARKVNEEREREWAELRAEREVGKEIGVDSTAL
mmetsp:Transcript_1447/g.2613  ORF Transcript_1447/g.2613 Transcript_1447/m.2613 type:complete len:177 (-) Transcript_1447:43-573(-)|eukprot:CAMPEP_0182464890 /NCGR_PEP_ID=MMETSP1319-20130603/8888_1 /TAXON_ID=172717 /ORGANISM="Bolidomonas pacifica, Strain RCC208" /LENGTH=176 /DNA_ID=CAMNT_0024664561 /DNA_START=172 /DNA_END=702 /DNA_ORIENTATION=+